MISTIKIIKILLKTPDPFYFYDGFINRPNLIVTIKLFFKVYKKTNKIDKLLIIDSIKKIISYLLFLIFFPVYFIYLIYLRKKKIVLICINTWQLGALVQQLDCLIKSKNDERLLLVVPNFLIEFKSYPRIYKNEDLIYSNSILHYFFVFPLLVISKFSQDAYDYEVLNIESKFNKLQNENSYKYDLKRIYDKISLDTSRYGKKIVTLHFKDGYFSLGASTRLSNPETYLETIKWLISQNYSVIRFIHSTSEKAIFNHPKYFELTCLNESEKIRQLKLIDISQLFICTQSGPSSYSFILETPFLQVNSFPINVSFVSKKKDFIIFKLIKSINEKFLTLREIKNKKFHLNFDENKERNKNILTENPSNEILTSVQEILENKSKYSFSELLKDCEVKIPAIDTNANIPESFYKKLKKINNL